MEKIPPVEHKENSEQHLISLLKEKGIEHPEAREFLNTWILEQEKIATTENTPAANINLNLKRARLYFKTGYIDEAFENFEDARTQAFNENMFELLEKIEKEMDELEKNLNS